MDLTISGANFMRKQFRFSLSICASPFSSFLRFGNNPKEVLEGLNEIKLKPSEKSFIKSVGLTAHLSLWQPDLCYNSKGPAIAVRRQSSPPKILINSYFMVLSIKIFK